MFRELRIRSIYSGDVIDFLGCTFLNWPSKKGGPFYARLRKIVGPFNAGPNRRYPHFQALKKGRRKKGL